jgi:hypothetical protein
MRAFRRSRTGGFSEEVKELAERIMEADGIKPLGPGERRPPGYYRAGWSTLF